MAENSIRELTKPGIDQFLLGKNISRCSVCGRFHYDVETQALSCQRSPSTVASPDTPVNVVTIVCRSCGAMQFLDPTVIARWLECQRKWWAKAGGQLNSDKRNVVETAKRVNVDSSRDNVAALATVFLIVLIAALLLHRYGGTELWDRPAITMVETGLQGFARFVVLAYSLAA